jgi:hypothetical protein
MRVPAKDIWLGMWVRQGDDLFHVTAVHHSVRDRVVTVWDGYREFGYAIWPYLDVEVVADSAFLRDDLLAIEKYLAALH